MQSTVLISCALASNVLTHPIRGLSGSMIDAQGVHADDTAAVTVPGIGGVSHLDLHTDVMISA